MKRLLPILLLSACVAAPGNPVPQAARLTDTTLTLRLSDGTTCRADWAASPVGRMDTCGPGYGYAVKLADRKNLARQLVEGIDLALGGGLGLAPMAEVVITDPAGIDHVFSSPDPARD
ncbi:hypothetical protein LHP98_09655 [Rhodobacter sp. Har01]|uniref:hypothetical protein n=1 Tax=Rhodobacter sp. Har01 TaxID=2883999 RepID=UPI001D06B30C|nr:hypothetical protein [Rhodobacter sp. Har01]MCB6178394.1 hypothetical protein [Rhodobacter sp. Har01]